MQPSEVLEFGFGSDLKKFPQPPSSVSIINNETNRSERSKCWFPTRNGINYAEASIRADFVSTAAKKEPDEKKKDLPVVPTTSDQSFLPELSDDEDENSSSEDSDEDEDSDSDQSDGNTSAYSGETSVTGTSEVSFASSREIRTRPYFNLSGPQDDDFLYCDICEDWIEDSCFDHSLNFVENDESSGSQLPNCLQFHPSGASVGLIGVFTKSPVQKGSMFGPLRGTLVDDFAAKSISEIHYLWEVKNFKGKSKYLLHEEQGGPNCNWLHLVRFAKTEEQQNLIAVQFKGDVYYKALVDIPHRAELLCFRGEGLPWAKSLPMGSLIAPKSKKLEKSTKIYNCPHCPAIFFNQKRFRFHLGGIRHNPLDDVLCQQCDFMAKTRSELRSHVYRKHDVKPHKCPLCTSRFKSHNRLKNHVLNVHGGGSGKNQKNNKGTISYINLRDTLISLVHT